MSGGRKPGTPKTGGRAKGTPNKKTLEVTTKLRELGCDPIEGMAKIAKRALLLADTTGDALPNLQLAGNMFKELAQYEVPKRKAIEHSGDGGGPIPHSIVVSYKK